MKLNLMERVEELLVKIPRTNSVAPMVESIYTTLKRDHPKTTYSLLESYHIITNNLRVHNYIKEVEDFVNESDDFFQSNHLNIQLQILSQRLNESRDSKILRNAIDIIDGIIEENYNELCLSSVIVESLKDYVWNPTIKTLYEQCLVAERGIDVYNSQYEVNDIISPVLPQSNGDTEDYTIYSEGMFIKIDENSLTTSKVSFDNLYRKLCESLNVFQFTKKGAYTKFNDVHIELNESDFGVNVKLDGKEVERSHLMEHLNAKVGWLSTNVRETALIDLVAEHFDKMVNVEFGKRIKSKVFEGRSLNVYNYNGKLYLQKVDKSFGVNELAEYHVVDGISEAKEWVGCDITNMVKDLLSIKESEIQETLNQYKLLEKETVEVMNKKELFLVEAMKNDVLNDYNVQEAVSKMDIIINSNKHKMNILKGNKDIANTLLEGIIDSFDGVKDVKFYAHEYLSTDKKINVQLQGKWTLMDKRNINVKS